ncbi:DUF1439 domain-containing protein [Stenotrophomonas sp. MMGLT7]|uniref:DUF1439 domain-containing protein n=1 Tax=Stenotrophomonas sp. MMGLT7 TaxID=2901227 RepID=UPI001E4655C9|nr:DUF1439 domain-containing protein [Stenotrophomonas sp. MMGLT7]MCD7099338.1 DUF1439 domain-containing protein [Stenotrophomonas sp. MMGLT7]
MNPLRIPARAIVLSLLLAAGIGNVAAAPAVQGNRISVAAEDVQHYLAGSFPQTHDTLGGLLALTVSDPRLALPPGNRLQMRFDLAMASAGSAPVAVGNVQLSSALRYDTQKQGFFLDQPTVDGFTPAAAGGRLDSKTRELLNLWLTDYARKEPVYRIDPAIAAMMGTLQVQSAAVENGQLVVHFNQDVEALIPPGLLKGG